MDFNNEKITWGISEKKDGSMKLYPEADNTDALNNRELFFGGRKLSPDLVVSAEITQGVDIAAVKSQDRGRIVPGVDGLVSAEPELVMAITVADCLPLYFFDPNRRAAGIAHVGWRGAESSMSAHMVEKMASTFSSSPADILVLIGPHIQNCHFEVGSEVAEKFSQYPSAVRKKSEKLYLDLAYINREQLKAAGVSTANISVSSECTYCRADKYFSFRRDHPENVQAQVAYIIVPERK